MPVDMALKDFKFDFINLLSIDVEGLNFEVLQGGVKVLEKSLVLCIEYDQDYEKQTLFNFLGKNFKLIKTAGCNLIFLNNNLSEKYKL